MHNRPVISRLLALTLILVFSLKSGAGLFIHSILHANDTIAEHPENEDQANKSLSYACSCIDEFFMPFDDAVAKSHQQPFLYPDPPVCFFDESVPFHTASFNYLRGPPEFCM